MPYPGCAATGGKYDGSFCCWTGTAFRAVALAEAEDVRGGRDADCDVVLGRRSCSIGGAGGGGGTGDDFGRDCFRGGGVSPRFGIS